MSSSRDVTANRKKEVWEEAGSEFYQESYPSGSGQAGHQRRPSRLNIPLPSQTARRNSTVADAGRKSGRRKSSVTALTYTSTMAVGTANNDIHVAVLPDLADESLPNEAKTWEELMKIKAMPIPMAQKKDLKAQLTTLPILKLKGWRLFKWRKLKAIKAFSRGWSHRWRNIVFLQTPLRTIEIKCGTSIVNVFLFIKWTLILNILMFFIIALFVIIPFIAHHDDFEDNADFQDSGCKVEGDGPHETEEELIKCCTIKHREDLKNETRESIATFIQEIFQLKNISIENNAFFYGYYEARSVGLDYNFALAYAMVTATIFVLCLALMVRNIGRGFKEMILAREGEYYKYSNLIFGGWDHYTKDEAGAKFKRKVILNEMKIALQTEKIKTQDLIRSNKQSMKLRFIQGVVHLIVLGLWALVGFLIYVTTDLSLTSEGRITITHSSWNDKGYYVLLNFSPQLVIIISNLLFPIILSWLGKFEKYSIQAQTTLILIRALFVRLLGIGLPAYLFYHNNYCSISDKHCTSCKHPTPKHGSRLSCWETSVSEQIYKLILTDLTLKLIITFIWEPSRILIGKLCPCSLAKKISSIRFNIVRHSLDIIYIQALSWIGFYFSPVLPGIVAIYCFIVFFTKKFSVLHNCNAVPDTFRTTRTTTIFIFTKLFSFVAATITIVFVLGYMIPSRGCGPFRAHSTPWNAVNKSLSEVELLNTIVENIVSPGVTTPVTILLILGTYYYYSVAQANRGMVETLKHLLVLEGHDKQYLFARLNTLRRKSNDSVRSSYSTVNAEARNAQ